MRSKASATVGAAGEEAVIAQDHCVGVPEVADEPLLLVEVERDAFVVVVREAAGEAHRVLRERQQPLLLRRHRETRAAVRVDDAADVVRARAWIALWITKPAGLIPSPLGSSTMSPVERDHDEGGRGDLLEQQAVRIDQEARRASGNARRDVRVDQVRHPVVRDQPIARGEIDARAPFRRARLAAASAAAVGRRAGLIASLARPCVRRLDAAARPCHMPAIVRCSCGRRPWKKWPQPGNTTTGSSCGRAQCEDCGERHDVVVLAVDHDRVVRNDRARKAS